MFSKIGNFLRAVSGNFGVILRNYPGVRAITLICVAVFVVQCVSARIMFFDIPVGALFDRLFGMFWPFAKCGAFWQPVTYAFLHGSLWHLLLNLFTLVFLGYAVEQIMGTPRFWGVFLVSSAVGGIGWMVFDYFEPHVWYAVSNLGPVGLKLAQRWGEMQSAGQGFNLCVGASGGVFGLMGAFAALCPRQRLTLLLLYVVPVHLQARHVAVLLVLLNLVEMVSSFGHVAYVAHLLGGVVGYFLGLRHYRRIARPFGVRR